MDSSSWVHTFYRVGAYYLAPIGIAPEEEQRIENGSVGDVVLRHSALAVYDSSLNLVLVLGM